VFAQIYGLSLALWLLAAIISLNKYPFVAIVASHMITWYLAAGRRTVVKKASKLKIVAGAGIVACTIGGLFFATEGNLGLENVVAGAVTRVFIVPTYTTAGHLATFPAIFPFHAWSGSRTLHFFLAPGTEKRTLDEAPYQEVSRFLYGAPSNMDAGFIGDGWAQLGYVGVAESAAIIFGILLLFDIWALRRRRELPTVPLVAFLVGQTANIFEVGLMSALLAGGVLAGPILYLLICGRPAHRPKRR
jgi:hypothetical protein